MRLWLLVPLVLLVHTVSSSTLGAKICTGCNIPRSNRRILNASEFLRVLHVFVRCSAAGDDFLCYGNRKMMFLCVNNNSYVLFLFLVFTRFLPLFGMQSGGHSRGLQYRCGRCSFLHHSSINQFTWTSNMSNRWPDLVRLCFLLVFTVFSRAECQRFRKVPLFPRSVLAGQNYPLHR